MNKKFTVSVFGVKLNIIQEGEKFIIPEYFKNRGSSLKPAYEPILLIRKKPEKPIAENVLKYGTGALNIDGCRIGTNENLTGGSVTSERKEPMPGDAREGSALGMFAPGAKRKEEWKNPTGRFPSNVLFSHLPECKVVGVKKVKSDGAFPQNVDRSNVKIYGKYNSEVREKRISMGDEEGETIEEYECAEGCPVKQLNDQVGIKKSGFMKQNQKRSQDGGYHGGFPKDRIGDRDTYGDEGFVSRFYYCSKPSQFERNIGLIGTTKKVNDGRQTPIDNPFQRGETERLNTHCTVKSVTLMRYLVKLLKPPKGGIVLDPFMGSGTTGMAAILEDMDFIGMENVKEYKDIADQRIEFVKQNKDVIFKEGLKPEIVKKVKIGKQYDPLKGVFG